MSKLIPASLASIALAFSLSACGSDASSTSSSATPSTGASSGTPSDAASDAAADLTVVDPWVKTADAGMSAVFGTLTNNTDKEITVASATTKASTMVQLHETVQTSDGSSKMQEKKGGFVVPAHGTFALEPGGNHIMLMKLTAPIKAGSSITVTLTLGDGSTVDFEALAKDFSGAQESYAPSSEATGSMGSMGH
ncbi:copper chaperone PCu(A)C [Nocardioides sp.]|uniref:copper chaperone PCu(A)C n=1 Tax=Nocardioides sp. TaxID=35761 RepID=UPI00262ACF67|nr:copper chaperone PCu(A)C [Nocardioides sp.]